ncbi:hypothetical protein [Brachybacterium paraconglomeratum]|uniref:hypothetical protein n=1 Tax=Brachybacterium paraconglomeratum TaxID=173362 RepID=UPI00223BDCAC|nr:hypothetical protein [Brachybacterium paraconglomeratum]MCT1436898.1 hypothetical protein [Brachybacterium paraconglomeratum]
MGAPALDTSEGVPAAPSAEALRTLAHDHPEWEEGCAALLAQVADVVRGAPRTHESPHPIGWGLSWN